MDPGDGVADGGGAQLVGERGDGGDLAAAGAEQRDELVDAGLLAGAHAVEHLGDGAAGARRAAGTSTGGATGAPEYHAVERSPTSTTSAPSPVSRVPLTRSG